MKIEKALEALVAKADVTHDNIIRARQTLLGQMKTMVGVLGDDPGAMKDLGSDLKQLRSNFDKLIDYEALYRQQLASFKTVKFHS